MDSQKYFALIFLRYSKCFSLYNFLSYLFAGDVGECKSLLQQVINNQAKSNILLQELQTQKDTRLTFPIKSLDELSKVDEDIGMNPGRYVRTSIMQKFIIHIFILLWINLNSIFLFILNICIYNLFSLSNRQVTVMKNILGQRKYFAKRFTNIVSGDVVLKLNYDGVKNMKPFKDFKHLNNALFRK